MLKHTLSALIFGLFINFSAGASMVSFFIVEAGLPESRAETRHSTVWENAFMDVFFEAGHIVSNAPILRLDRKPQDDILQTVAFDISDARLFGIDYIIIAILDFTENLPLPAEISFFIYSVNTGERIHEKQIPGKTYRTQREEFDDLKSIARGLAPFISQ